MKGEQRLRHEGEEDRKVSGGFGSRWSGHSRQKVLFRQVRAWPACEHRDA